MDRDHRVRPRWVWSGLLLALLGTCLLALWIATWRAGAGIGGAILLVLGGAAAMRGGILYDTHGARPVAGDIDEVRDADVHRGTAPGDVITDPHLRAEARETSRMTDQLLRAAQDAPWRPLDRVGADGRRRGRADPPRRQHHHPARPRRPRHDARLRLAALTSFPTSRGAAEA